VGIISL